MFRFSALGKMYCIRMSLSITFLSIPVHLAPEMTVNQISLVPDSLLKSKIDGSVTEICGKRGWKKQEIDALSEFWHLHAKNDKAGQV